MSRKHKIDKRKELYEYGANCRILGLSFQEIAEEKEYPEWQLEAIFNGYEDKDRELRSGWDDNGFFT